MTSSIVRRASLVCASFCVCAALAGCYQYAPMSVYVRDRNTQAPIAGASVRVSNTSTINPARPDAAEGETDADGHVRLRVALYNRLLIRVEPPDRAPYLFNGDHPASMGPTDWFAPTLNQRGERGTIEVRIAQ